MDPEKNNLIIECENDIPENIRNMFSIDFVLCNPSDVYCWFNTLTGEKQKIMLSGFISLLKFEKLSCYSYNTNDSPLCKYNYNIKKDKEPPILHQKKYFDSEDLNNITNVVERISPCSILTEDEEYINYIGTTYENPIDLTE
tara:strand:+ start:2898 stop:3323 length:426 start_codon:yes stop_codon:yes gene_type:complete